MRMHGPGFNRHVLKPHDAANIREVARELRLRLEHDDPAITDPPRQPIDEAALVGADVTGDVGRAEVLPDLDELPSLVAQQRLQGANSEPDAGVGEPGLENRHRSYPPQCAPTLFQTRPSPD